MTYSHAGLATVAATIGGREVTPRMSMGLGVLAVAVVVIWLIRRSRA